MAENACMAQVYHLTAAGKEDLWGKSVELPVEYRRLLALM